MSRKKQIEYEVKGKYGCWWEGGTGVSPEGNQCGECYPDYENKCSHLKKYKQIEEMAKIACVGFREGDCENCKSVGICSSYTISKKLYNANYRKQSEGELSKAHIQAHYEAIYALADMVYQFGYSTTFRNQDAVCDGGLSALEYAFGALLDCGCRMNSNGTITLKNLWVFQEEIRAKMKGGE